MDMSQDPPKVGVCGFQNIGNTCYMNSILQLLIHCKPIVNFLYKKDESDPRCFNYIKQVIGNNERKKQKLGKDDVVEIQKSDIDNTLTLHLAEIIQAIVDKGSAVVTPSSLKRKIDELLPSFRGHSQHDSHEFLINFLDKVFDETGIQSEPVINNVPEIIKQYVQLGEEVKSKLEKTDNIEEKKQLVATLNKFKNDNLSSVAKYNGLTSVVNYFKNKYNPLIYQLITFIQSSVKCSVCDYESIIYEPTTCIQVDVQDTLDQSFKKYMEPEILDGDAKYNCPICKEKQVAAKSAKLWRLPKIMFVQLKRFVQQNNKISKNNTAIKIPMEFDVEEYLDKLDDRHIQTKYKLVGFSNHMGDLGGGHYTADAIDIVDNKQWYHFDDSRVAKYNGDQINTSNAYVLMYEQQ